MMNKAHYGRNGDTMMAHVTPGEIMIPPEVQTPDLIAAISQAIRNAGGDPQEYVAGQGKVNPYTGDEEFFFKKLFKKILPIIGAAAGTFLLPGIGTGLGASLGGLGSALGTGAQILSGINTARGLFSKEKTPKQQEVKAAQAPAYKPERPQELSAPSSLNELSAFSPEQKRSNLATTGLNTGLGSEEDKYYRNLLQRSLIGEGNKVQQQDNFLLPVESQYFSKKGYDTSNIMNFLQAIRG